MTKITLLFCGALAASAAASWGLDLSLTPAVSYGFCFLDGAPNAYENFEPDAKTNQPLEVALDAGFGRFGVTASYAQRYELYSNVGKVHDFAVVARAGFLSRERWALYGVAGVGVSKAPVAPAFLFGKEGVVFDWTPVVGARADFRPWDWLETSAAVSYRERLQIVNFFELDPYYGSVKSPALDLTADLLFEPWPFVAVGPSVRQIFYGPYDYYLYSQTNRMEGWVTAKETYVLATLAFNLGELW